MTAFSHAVSSGPPAILSVAAKALQSFVLGSDKLREMVGATQLIEDFCSRSFSETFLSACGIPAGDYVIITAAAGQTTIHFNHLEHARTAASLWPWAAHCHAPGMEVHVAVSPLGPENGGYIGAIEEIQKALALSRNSRQILDLPAAPPPAMRAPRSGKVAVAYERFNNMSEEVDAEAKAKRQRRAEIRRAIRPDHAGHPMFDAFGFDPELVGVDLNSLFRIPLLLRDFQDGNGNPASFSARQPSLAVIHADGNGLGQAFIDLSNGLRSADNVQAMECITAFSEGFRQVGLNASHQAMAHLRTMFLDPLPVLPVVLAGDDLTVVTRGELAVPFAEAWLEAFENETERVLDQLKKAFPLVAEHVSAKCFSAGAGVCFFPRAHPLLDAYEHCEELASIAKGEAKKQAKPESVAPSSLAYQRMQAGDDSSLITQSGIAYRLTAMPYYVGRYAEGLRSLAKLRRLRTALDELPSGSKRQLLGEMRQHPAAAKALFDRAIQVRLGGAMGEETCAEISAALEAAHGEPGAIWAVDSDLVPCWTSIADALHWSAVEPEFPKKNQPESSNTDEV